MQQKLLALLALKAECRKEKHYVGTTIGICSPTLQKKHQYDYLIRNSDVETADLRVGRRFRLWAPEGLPESIT